MKHQGTSPQNVTELLLSPIVQTAAQLAIRNNRYTELLLSPIVQTAAQLTRPLFGFGGRSRRIRAI